MSEKNMELWNRVCVTNPKYTKKVEQRGGYTAICAMFQVQSATEVFGPAGKGWGWSFSEPLFVSNGTVVIKCTLWHGDKSTTVEQYGQKKIGDATRPDEDAVKKAATDALTKCLSYLGFNADVFLGKFDDSKYLNEIRPLFDKPDNVASIDDKRIKAVQFKDDYLKALSSINQDNLNDLFNLQHTKATALERLKQSYPELAQEINDATVKVLGFAGAAA